MGKTDYLLKSCVQNLIVWKMFRYQERKKEVQTYALAHTQQTQKKI